jgi:hypothetical protein
VAGTSPVRRPETALWTYPWDLADEGVARALATMQERAGATAVNVAAVYHAGKFLLPHNPRRRVVFPRSGTLYFRPSPSWYGKLRIRPPLWEGLETGDFWRELSREAAERDMEVTAWVLCLHNSGIGFEHPDCAVENAYGDRIHTSLCPRQPDVREYLAAVVADIAESLDVRRIVLESLEYLPFQHGYHHEVVGVPTGPIVELLLALCFCRHCESAAADSGADPDALRTWVRTTLDAYFADPYSSALERSWPEVRGPVEGELTSFLDLRKEALASLLEEVVSRIRAASSARIGLVDFGPLAARGPDGRAWDNGVDLDRQLPLVDELHPTFYFTELDVHVRKIEEYAALVDDERPIHAAVCAIPPETDSEERLREQVEALRPHVAGVSFYNYGLMALPALDWVRRAMEA